MKRIIYVFIALFALFYMDNAFAACSYNEKATLQKIVSNVNISYDYEMFADIPIFKVTVSNAVNVYMTNEKGIKFYPDQSNQIILSGYKAGTKNKFSFYGNSSCVGEHISDLYATIPTYNSFYNLDVCEDAREYELCQKWVSHGLSKNEFIKNVKEYKTERDKKDDKPIKSKNAILEFLIGLVTNIWFYVVLTPIVVFIIIKLIKKKKDKESFGF